VLAKPESAMLQHYQTKKRDNLQLIERHKQNKDIPAVTKDGKNIALRANIELVEDVVAMKALGANGVGLFRTEYLFMNRDTWPPEQEQYETYRQVLAELDGQVLTIRTIDLGADKQVDGGRHDLNNITNPALGLRAIRLCLQDPEIFLPQLLQCAGSYSNTTTDRQCLPTTHTRRHRL